MRVPSHGIEGPAKRGSAKSITKRKAALPDADEWNGKPGKVKDLVR